MNVLIVHAHPEPQSFSTALCTTAVEVLTAQGHAVVVSDLYAQHFNPVASAADFPQRKRADYFNYALEQRNAVDTGSLPADIAAEIAKVQAADLVILNFPLYWFSTPAILKGWIDRVFVSGLFYGGKRIYGKGGMAGKKALVSVTLGGREDMLSEGGIHGDLTGILKPLLQGSLGYVGMTVLQPFAAYHVPYLQLEARAAILGAWREALAALDTRPALAMPDLKQFDDVLRPLPKSSA